MNTKALKITGLFIVVCGIEAMDKIFINGGTSASIGSVIAAAAFVIANEDIK